MTRGADHSLPYMPQLDGLRAIAVLAVLYTHYWPESHWLFGVYWGGYGVRLFFVLSGFLITTILLRDLNTAPLLTVWPAFIIRRAFRLWPLMLVCVTAAAALDLPRMREALFWHLLYLSNVWTALVGDWYSLGAGAHLWSLACEEQFYLLWPVLLLLTPLRFLPLTLACLALMAVAFRVAVRWFGGYDLGSDDVAADALTPAQFDALALGAMIAVARERRRLLAGIAICGAALCVVPNANVTYTAAAMICVWIVAQAADGKFPVLNNAMLRYVGAISYGVYLLHGFVPHLIARLELPLGGNAFRLAAITATIALAALSWHAFERPIMRFGRRYGFPSAARFAGSSAMSEERLRSENSIIR